MKLVSLSSKSVSTDIKSNKGLHNNLLEFVVIIINMWLAMVHIHWLPTRRCIFHFMAKGSSRNFRPHIALSCMSCISYACPNSLAHYFFLDQTNIREGKHRSGHSQLLVEWIAVHVGVHYQGMIPSSNLSNMPPTLRAVVSTSRSIFIQQDRGVNRLQNNKTVCTWATNWQLAQYQTL